MRGPPSAPTDFDVVTDHYHIMTLAWDIPTTNGGVAITGYNIEWSSDGSLWSTLVDNTNSTAVEYEHISSRLTPGDDFYYRVRAINSVGHGSWSTEESNTAIDAEGIGIATSVTASITSTSHISVSWSAPSDIPSAGEIVSYSIYKSYDNGDSWESIGSQSATPTTYMDTGPFTIGSSYGYRLTTSYSEQRFHTSISDFSDEAYITFSTAPGAPTGLSAAANGPTTIDLSWVAPTSMGGAAISGYRIEVSTDGGTNFSQLVVSQSKTTYSHTDLSAGSARHYRVRASNSVGNSGWSNTANASTAAATVPGAPTGLTAAADGQSTIDLSWTAPASNGGTAISGYRIEVSTDGGTNFSQLVVSQSKTTYSHTGLSAGSARHYRVRASNSVGNSGWSNTANATTGAATAPTAPRSLTATAIGQTTINLSWTAPASNGGTAISGYRIEWSANGTSNWQNVSPAHMGTERIYADTGLNSGTTRHYRVYASNSVGESTAASNVDSATTISASTSATAPSAPRSLTATASGQTSINLSWSDPSSTGGASITGYRIQWSTDGNDPWTNLTRTNPTATATTDSHTGLTAGTTRYYRVYAINSVGESPASSATTATTGTATAPTAPRFLRATASGQTTINLSWSAPSSTGDASIIGYRIEVSDDGSTNWEDLVENHIETTYSHTGLTESTTRHYRVYAINSVGESPASDVVNATTATGTSTGIVVSFDAASSQVNETTATATVQVNVNPAPTTSLTMTYSLGGTATENADYTIQGSGSVIVAANATSTNLAIVITNDPVDESDETVIVTLTSGTGYDTGSQGIHTLTIVDDDDPDVQPLLFATTILNQSFLVGVPIDEVMFPDAAGGTQPYHYALTPDPPAGLELDASTQTLSGTPSERLSPTTFTYTVTDDENATAIQTFTIEVTAPQDLVFADSVADQMCPVGKAIADHVLPSALGGVLPYMYTVTPDLPKGIAFDAETRRLSGTPSEVTKSQVYTYTVEDRAGTSSKLDFDIKVYAIIFTKTISNQSFPRGQAIDPLVLPEVTGGVPPIQYTLTLFDLPFDLRFDARTRTISGTPLVITPRIALTYTATDHHGAQDSLLFSIGIISPVHADKNPGIPQEFRGYSNYPNPFQSSTNLVFDLPWPARVQVEVLDITGRRLVSSPSVYLTAGWGNEIELSDLNLPSGAYLYRIQATSLDDNSSSVYFGHFMSVR